MTPPAPGLGLLDAARACAAAGDHARAAALYEQACDFAAAGREALLGGDAARSLLLAGLGGDAPLAAEATAALTASDRRGEAQRAAAELEAQGFSRLAGELLAAIGEPLEAARLLALGRDACRAAECFEQASRPADAARALEAALRADPGDTQARLALGRLLARHGRLESAVKALQQLPEGAPARDVALPLLAKCLAALGLDEAASDVRERMARLGVVAPIGSGSAPAAPANEVAPAASRGAAAVLFGRYEVLHEGPASPHARIVEAKDRITGEHVAVKLLATAQDGAGRDALLRFEREARALEKLRHPSVVPLRAYLPEGPALVLPWMAGGSLAARLAAAPVAPARAAEIACAVLAAVGEAHRMGILHRDIKPANVLFDDAGVARLADFGAAHLGDLSRTVTAGNIGTLVYMSPEQRVGRPATVASDLYGVGVLLVEMLTGEPPEPTAARRMRRLPSECHPDLDASHDALVARFVADDPAERPAEAFDATRAIRALRWSDRLPPPRSRSLAPPRSSERPAAAPSGGRLTAPSLAGLVDPALRHDAWLERDVLVLSLDEAELARARAFARAGHPVLPLVLRVDTSAGEVWVAPPRGVSLASAPRALSAGDAALLGEAVAALHAAGGAHGAIDDESLSFHDGALELRYPRALPDEGAAARDLAAVDAFASRARA